MVSTETPTGALSFSGKRLRALREGRHLSPQEFADAVGVNRSSVGVWELGKISPTARAIGRMCAVLRCRPNALFDIDGRE